MLKTRTTNMSTFFRNLPHFVVNSMKRRHMKSQFQKLQCMVFGHSKERCFRYSLMSAYSNNHITKLDNRRICAVPWRENKKCIEDSFISWREKFWLVVGNIQAFSKEKPVHNFHPAKYEASKSTGGSARLHNLHIKMPPFDASNPFLAQIIINNELHKGGDRSCLHVEFDICNSKMEYEAGDYVAVYPKNDSSLVERLGELTNTDLDKVMSFASIENHRGDFPSHATYHAALSHYLEITALPSTDVIKKLAQYCTKEEDKIKMLLMAKDSKEGKALYQSFIIDASRNIVHIMEDIKSCRPPPDVVCKLLPRLQPRFYSISSSPKLFPESVHVTAVVVKYKTKSGRLNKGVTTTWLAQHKPEQGQLPRVPIYIRKSEFRLPIRTETPIIMVGTGTGLAPFRGFLQERAHSRWHGEEVGDTVLYFGCRHRQQDYIYQEELEKYESSGLLTLKLAFSRDQAHKVYVTHLLEKDLQLVWDVLGNRNGHFYVCGDARNMAVDVKKVVLRAIKEVGGKSEADAIKFFNYLESSKKYCSDVWS